ncbi:MAG: leucine-rich repeat protein [Lachnospiraceae bacterium]
MKVKKWMKRGMSILLAGAMVLSGLPFGGAGTVQAATGEYQTSITDDKYIDGDDFQCIDRLYTWLKDAFGIDGSSGKLVLKLLFGKTAEGEPLEWYIAGHDCKGHDYWQNVCSLSPSNIVLFSTKPFGTSKFNDNQNAGNTYKGSTLANTLESYCYSEENAKNGTARFTKAEDELMQGTKLGNAVTGTSGTAVKLYVPHSDLSGTDLKLGSSDDITIINTYYQEQTSDNRRFWIRSAGMTSGSGAPIIAYGAQSTNISWSYVDADSDVVPACNLDMTNVLFMSKVPASTEGVLSTKKGNTFGDVMTLRVKGSDKIASKAYYTANNITVVKDHQDSDLYLCVQGEHRTSGDNITMDYAYSKKITGTERISAQTIKEAVGSEIDLDLSKCKIWLETSDAEDNLTYAVKAEAMPTTSASAYVTTDDLKSITESAGGKVYFGVNEDGTTPLVWYIEGNDADLDNLNNIVLLSEASLGTTVFAETQDDYSGITYANSTLAKTLKRYCYGGENAKFNEAEDKLMLRTTLENDSADEPVKLYVPRRVGSYKYYVAAKDTIEVATSRFISATATMYAWVRTKNGDNNAYVVSKETEGNSQSLDSEQMVQPAFALDLTNVLFGSAAPAAKATVLFDDNGIYTLRIKDDENNKKIGSTAKYTQDGVIVTKGNDAGDLYLYVQDADGVYSVKVAGKEGVKKIVSLKNMYDPTDANTKIWLETTVDHITYASEITEYTEEVITGISSVAITDITIPNVGEEFAADSKAACATEGVTTTEPVVSYFSGTESVTGTAKYGTTYTASVTLSAEDGYLFQSDISTDDVTVNGNKATSVTLNEDGTLTITYDFTTAKAKLASVTQPDNITGVENGTEQTAEALGLPETVAIVTEDPTVTSAKVTWDLENLASGSYDPENTTEQTFTVNGTVTLPENISNPDDVSLDVTIQVTVAAEDESTGVKISSVAVTGITVPEGGKAFDTAAVCDTDGVATTTPTVSYTEQGSSEAVTGSAKFNTTYTASITLTAKEGYVFKKGIRKDNVTVNGEVATSVTLNEDGTLTITYEYTTAKAKLIGVTQPKNITVANGTAKTVEALGLPETVSIVTEDTAVTSTEVTWNLDTLAEGTYDPTEKDRQTFKVNGTVALPESISNPDDVSLTATIQVTVVAEGETINITIPSVAITDITVPAGGSVFDTDAVCETEGIERIEISYWAGDEDVTDDKAMFNMDYTALITVFAQDGYIFDSDISKNNVTINNNEADRASVSDDEKQLSIIYEFKTAKAKLTSITQPKNVTVANGTAKTVEALGLPKTVSIVTEDTAVTSAEVTWNLNTLASGSYDPSVKTQQTFKVNGTVTLPAGIDQNGKILNVTIQVTVNAGKTTDTTTPLDSPAKGETVTDTKTKAAYTVTNDAKTAGKTGTVEYKKPTNSKATTVTIPATVKIAGKTYKVTTIADNAFKSNKTIKKVTIGSNVQTIGKNAFSGCTKLATVTIGKNVTTIGDKAFYKCIALKKITIPSKVKKIGKSAFQGCTKLTSVTMGANVTTIGANAFYGCTKLATVTIGKNVTTIGDKAFYKCIALKKITIPSKVKKIGKSAFEGCKNLKTITITTQKLKSTTVGSKAFKGTPKNATVKVPKKSLNAYKKFLYKKGVNQKAAIKK